MPQDSRRWPRDYGAMAARMPAGMARGIPPPSVARDRLPWLRHTSQGGRDTPHPCPPPDSPPPAPHARTHRRREP